MKNLRCWLSFWAVAKNPVCITNIILSVTKDPEPISKNFWILRLLNEPLNDNNTTKKSYTIRHSFFDIFWLDYFESQVATSAVVHVATSAVVHVAASAVVQVEVFASSSANAKLIVHNKNTPSRRKENFFIFSQIKYKMFPYFEKQLSIKYRFKAYCPISNLKTNRLWL